ncbi:flagellar motor protein MotB [Gemmobacter lanyuensis]
MAKAKVVPFQPPSLTMTTTITNARNAPVGAPAWLATFADIATNLMAFFVLILGFAQFDEPSFQKMAGAMRERFGVQVVPGSSGESVIDLQPSPTTEEGTEPGSTPRRRAGRRMARPPPRPWRRRSALRWKTARSRSSPARTGSSSTCPRRRGQRPPTPSPKPLPKLPGPKRNPSRCQSLKRPPSGHQSRNRRSGRRQGPKDTDGRQ